MVRGEGESEGEAFLTPLQVLCDIISKLLVCQRVREEVWSKVGGALTVL